MCYSQYNIQTNPPIAPVPFQVSNQPSTQPIATQPQYGQPPVYQHGNQVIHHGQHHPQINYSQQVPQMNNYGQQINNQPPPTYYYP